MVVIVLNRSVMNRSSCGGVWGRSRFGSCFVVIVVRSSGFGVRFVVSVRQSHVLDLGLCRLFKICKPAWHFHVIFELGEGKQAGRFRLLRGDETHEHYGESSCRK